jgi:uncharacterized protein
MAGNRPEERVERPAAYQSWRAMTFLHWRVDAEMLSTHLPRGLEPDIVDGSAWVSLTPFRVERFRFAGVLTFPVSSFPETNFRTYVRDRHGRDGLWFFSLDVTNVMNVALARLGAIPYYWSSLSLDDDGDVSYTGRRRFGPPAQYNIIVRPGPS